jgi:hypothetical protein
MTTLLNIATIIVDAMIAKIACGGKSDEMRTKNYSTHMNQAEQR